MINSASVGGFIAKRRNAAGFTQERLAERLHTTHQVVTEWERGDSVPDAGILLELSHLLSVPVESILTGGLQADGPSSGRSPAPTTFVSPVRGSEDTVGYRVKIMHRPALQVAGFTRIIPPHGETEAVGSFVSELMAAGKIEVLRRTSATPPWILGLGSWDSECEPGGQRYTMCIDDMRQLDLRYKLHRQAFERSDWMCFDVPQDRFDSGQFWKDNPYQMLRALGYRFHVRVGVHLDAVPPDHDEETNPGVEFWISVMKETADCNVCRSRPQCAKVQPFAAEQ